MTLLPQAARKAVEAAMEALEDSDIPAAFAILRTLRAALQQQEVPSDSWRHAVDNALVDSGLDCTTAGDDTHARVRELLDWTRTIALDPAVSEEAQALVDKGRQEVPREPVAWRDVHDHTNLYFRKPVQGDVEPLYASPSTTQQQEAGSVPAEVIAWRDAYAEYVAASDAYNARLTAIREREAAHLSEFGRDNPHAEWKAIDAAHRKWHALLRPMFDVLAAAPSTPEKAEGGKEAGACQHPRPKYAGSTLLGPNYWCYACGAFKDVDGRWSHPSCAGGNDGH